MVPPAPVMASEPMLTGAAVVVSRPNEGAVANGGCVLILTIIVAGDGTSADIYASAHGCVANVGEVRHL